MNTAMRRDWVHDWKWSRLGRTAPRQHRMFWSNAANRLALCDESADEPEHTDDGILWVDISRPMRVGKIDGVEGVTVSIPVTDNNGRQSCTMESVQGAAKLRQVTQERMGNVWATEFAGEEGDALLLLMQDTV